MGIWIGISEETSKNKNKKESKENRINRIIYWGEDKKEERDIKSKDGKM